MSGNYIFETVLSENSRTVSGHRLRDVVDTFDPFQRSVLTDLLEAAVEPENYILTEDKAKIIRTTLQTMNEEQKTALYACVGYAQAMFAH